jgi:hypothetical protein
MRSSTKLIEIGKLFATNKLHLVDVILNINRNMITFIFLIKFSQLISRKHQQLISLPIIKNTIYIIIKISLLFNHSSLVGKPLTGED